MIEEHLESAGDPTRGRLLLEEFQERYARHFRKTFDWKRTYADQLLLIFGNSHFLAEKLVQHPDWAEAFLEGKLETSFDESRPLDETQLKKTLRAVKYQKLLDIAIQDLSEATPVDELLIEWSDVADDLIATAYAWVFSHLAQRFGEPCAGCVIALGKLGSRELNISSDVDLLFLYEVDGTHGTTSHHEFFVRLATFVSRILSEQTEDGFVFRVDHELRPEGGQGPLANSLEAAERYYESFGSDWERHAFVRARPVAGDVDLGVTFLKNIEPFIYRRTLSLKNLTGMRNMKMKMETEASRSGKRNIKLGPGGIREVEFFVQAHQLLYGGKVSSLKTVHTFTALENLVNAQILHPSVASSLWEAYAFLRRTENMLQIVDDRQIHTLPTDASNRVALAKRLGIRGSGDHKTIAAFEELLHDHQSIISKYFHGLFAEDYDQLELEQAIESNLSSCRDHEERVDSLAWFRRQEVHRIGFLDLAERLPLRNLLHRLTLLAETILKTSARLLRKELEARYGTPHHEDGVEAGFAIIGFGKLGSDEMDYGSDLDLGFLFSGRGRTDGATPISNTEFFTKLAQRIVSLISSRSRYGRPYTIDLDLRPSGRAGMLVSSFTGFATYHLQQSTSWERLTLLKARIIDGDEGFQEKTRSLLGELGTAPLREDPGTIARELREMQLKFRAQETEKEKIHLKLMPGGTADLDLILRYYQLLSVSKHEGLKTTNSFALLEELHEAGCIKTSDAHILQEALHFYRLLVARIRLQTGAPTDTLDPESEVAGVVTKQLHFKTTEELLNCFEKHRKAILQLYERLFYSA